MITEDKAFVSHAFLPRGARPARSRACQTRARTWFACPPGARSEPPGGRCGEDLIGASAAPGMSLSYPRRAGQRLATAGPAPRSAIPVMTSTYEVLKCPSNNPVSRAFPWRAAALAARRADVRETAERRSLRNEKIFVQCLGKPALCVYAPVMSGAPKAARGRALPAHRAGSLPGERDLRGKEPFGQPSEFTKFPYQAHTADRRRARRIGRPGHRGVRPR